MSGPLAVARPAPVAGGPGGRGKATGGGGGQVSTDAGRARKLADRIAQIVAEMLERRVKDPRLGFVTVTDAKLTGDLREATVYYTVYGSADEREGTAAALRSATGLIRTEVGRQTGLRHTPSLSFVPDTLPDGARHMEELVARARAADEALAQAREGAQPAGDPDPYRVPPDHDADGEDEDGPGGAAQDETAVPGGVAQETEAAGGEGGTRGAPGGEDGAGR